MGDQGRRTNIAKADVFYELWIDIRFVDNFFKKGIDDVVQWCVFKATFEAFGQRRTDCQCNDHIVGILLGATGISAEQVTRSAEDGSLHGREPAFARCEVIKNRIESFGSHYCSRIKNWRK